ncbi:hypothetical protein [Brevundimonas staleyi]|uniref:Uncharacterized protein n=1 Tax=Brevundimonas staleyi TaxID=74326 RepID=A0ABW0FMY1_9CAUL
MKKLLAVAAFVGALLPTTVHAEPNEACLLWSGCYFVDGHWVCPDPQTMMDCVEP